MTSKMPSYYYDALIVEILTYQGVVFFVVLIKKKVCQSSNMIMKLS